MAKRRSSSRRSSKGGIPPWALALGAGVGAYVLFRSSGSGAALPPVPAPVSDPTPSTPRVPSPGGSSPTPTGSSPSATLQRLVAAGAAGALARQVFYVQSLIYSYGPDDAFGAPDAVLGPQTWTAINTLRRAAGIPQDTTWTADVPQQVVSGLKTALGMLPDPRILPFALPRAVVDRINAEVVPVAGRGAPVLQASTF